jgi:hypothetical protein
MVTGGCLCKAVRYRITAAAGAGDVRAQSDGLVQAAFRVPSTFEPLCNG